MQTLAWVTYLLFLVYAANLLLLSAAAARQANRSIWLFGAGEPVQRFTGWAFRIAFVVAAVWPVPAPRSRTRPRVDWGKWGRIRSSMKRARRQPSGA